MFRQLRIRLDSLDNAASPERLRQQGIAEDRIADYQRAINGTVQMVHRVEKLASLPGVALVQETNQLDKRLGDVRQLGAPAGSWLKISGGHARYEGMRLRHTELQLGFDQKTGNHLYGIMGSYTGGHSQGLDLAERHTSGGFGLYYAYAPDEGLFVDVIGKYLRNNWHYDFPSSSEIDSQSAPSNTFMASAQIGYHARLLNDTVFVEPSAELVAAHASGYTLRGKDISVKVNNINPLYAKIGASAGINWSFNEQQQLTLAAGLYRQQNLNAAAPASLYDADSQHTGARSKDNRYLANVSVFSRLSDDWRLYARAETSFGGKLKDDYSAQIGVRYQF